MENIVKPSMNRLWEASTKGGLSDQKELASLLQAKPAADSQAQSVANNANQGEVSTSEQGRVLASRFQQMERAYQYSETTSLQLITQEGDEVNLDFRQLYAQYQSYKAEQQGEQGPQGVRYFESREALEMTAFEERFAFSVKGDLNEKELAAVFDVFEQVDALANDFFQGDLEKALQKAMDLNMDYGQLQSMSLNLTQTSVEVTRYQQEAMAQYQKMQSDSVENPVKKEVDMSNLPPYLQQWQKAIDQLDEQFKHAQAVMDKLMSGIMNERFPMEQEKTQQGGWLERVQAFHESLLAMAQANPNASEAVDEAEPISDNASIEAQDKVAEPKAQIT